MTLELSAYDRAFLVGDRGPAGKMAMSIIIQMAEVCEAPRLLSVTSAHIDSALYMGDATLEFAERLVSLQARVCIPATLNVSGLDEYGWQEWDVPPTYAAQALRQMQAYLKMGCVPTWTCTPYQTPYRPAFGQQIAWGESNAIAFANSVLGARTERYPDLLDICAAITGRVPDVGLHRTEKRAGQVVLYLENISTTAQEKEIFYPLLGYLTGKLAGERIPVIQGLRVKPGEDQLKALCAAAASSGGVALVHIVGVTPEAPTLEAAMQGQLPLEIIPIREEDLQAAYQALNLADGVPVDLVVVGCPHLSLPELRQLARQVKAKQRHPDIQFLAMTSRSNLAAAEVEGTAQVIRDFGGRFSVDTCVLCTPMLNTRIKALMTNSGKCAYYTPGLLSRQVYFGSLEACIQTALSGKLESEQLW